METSFSPTAHRATCAATLLLGVLLCAETSAGEPAGKTPVTPEAAAHFRAGVAHLTGKQPDRYAQAYREFKAAYELSPSWTMLGNLGIAAQALERYGEATDALTQYLEKASDLIPREKEQLHRDLAQMRSEQATVTFEYGAGPFWVVDTRLAPGAAPIVNEYGPFEGRAELRVRAGQHEFQLERDGAPSGSPWAVALLAGDTTTHHFASPPAPPLPVIEFPAVLEPEPGRGDDVSQPSRTVPYVLWGAGAVAAGATAFLYFQSRAFRTDADEAFERACPLGERECATTSAVEARAAMSAADTKAAHWRTAALVTGIGAAGALITGTVLYFVSEGPSEGPSPDAAAALTPSVSAWVSPTGVGLTGRF